MAELRQVVWAVLAGLLGLQRRQRVLGRAAPERKRPAGQPPIQLRADAEAVVGVVDLVLDHLGQLVPDRAPGLFALQRQRRREAAWKAEGEVEPDQGPLATLLQ